MTTLMASQQAAASPVHWEAPRLVATFKGQGSGSLTSPAWRVAYAEHNDGPRADRAEIVIPQPYGSVNSNNNEVAFNSEGPAAYIKKFSAVTIKRVSNGVGEVVWVGVVVNTWHDRDSGSLIVEAFDDRWWLETVRIVGRWIQVTPFNTGDDEYDKTEVAYQQGVPCWFNRNGPDRIYSDYGPVFAPHPNFGLEDGEDPSKPGSNSRSKAGWWSFGDILEYLWRFYSSSSETIDSFPWVARVPSWLQWSASYASNVDSESVDNFNGSSSGSNSPRKGRSISLEGMSLLDAFDLLFSTAGNYTVDVAPLNDGGARAELRCVPTKFGGGSSHSLSLPAAGQMTTEDCITGGRYGEIGRDYISGCAGSGSRVIVETRCTTKAEDGGPHLVKGWSSSRELAFKAAAAGQTVTVNGKSIVGNGVAGPDSWELACRLFPEVLTTWRLSKAFNFQDATCFQGYPFAKIARPVYRTQLTLQSDAGATSYTSLRCPIYIEVETATDVWDLAEKFDGLEVWDNGMIYLPMLRELTSSMKAWKFSGAQWEVSSGALAIAVRNIRMNLAIPLDHNLTAAAQINMGATVAGAEMLDGGADAAMTDSVTKFDYRDLSSAKYTCELRTANSFSRPESAGYSADSALPGGDPANIDPSTALRSDHALLRAHVRRIVRENARIKRDGLLRIDGRLVPYQIGTKFGQFNRGSGGKPYPANAILRGVKWVVEPNRCYTMLRLG